MGRSVSVPGGDAHLALQHELTGQLVNLDQVAGFDFEISHEIAFFSGLNARVTGDRSQGEMLKADRERLLKDGAWSRLIALKEADNVNFNALKSAFDRLPPDPHIKEEHKDKFARWRTYAGFFVAMIAGKMCVFKLPHVAYTPADVSGSTQYRAGELDSRYFDQHEGLVLNNPLFYDIIAAAIDRQTQSTFDDFSSGRVGFEVKTQLFRIATIDGHGWVTPEGRHLFTYKGFEHMKGTEMGERLFHRDSEKGVTVLGMGTYGDVNRPLSHVADPVTGSISQFSANQPGRIYGIDDARVLHTVDDLVGEGGRRVAIANVTPYPVKDAIDLLDRKYSVARSHFPSVLRVSAGTFEDVSSDNIANAGGRRRA